MLSFFKGKGGDDDALRKSPVAVIWDLIKKPFDKNEKEVAKLRPLVDQVNALGTALKARSDEELKAQGEELKRRFRDLVTQRLRERGADWREPTSDPLGIDQEYERLRRAVEKGVLDELMPEVFALTREVSERTVGLRHYDVQLVGGAVLHAGHIAEMKTGEGKTLVATLPVVLNALTGRGVHLITVNDYLAERDANWMRPIYEFLGLSVAFITNSSSQDDRKVGYQSDVVYGTNSEVGFDYLRDNMATDPDWVVQRPLNFAIVDEVDNILIDEARTPLIISAQVEQSERAQRKRRIAKVMDGVARKLVPATSDRDVEEVIARCKRGKDLDVEALNCFLLERGCLQTGLTYLIHCYVEPDSPARAENVAKLLALRDELQHLGLSGPQLYRQLTELAGQTAPPVEVAELIRVEAGRVVQPFAEALALLLAVIAQFSGDRESQIGAALAVLQQTLHLHADFLETIEDRMRSRGDDAGLRYDAATALLEEFARRRWLDDEEVAPCAEAVFDREPAEAAQTLVERIPTAQGNLPEALRLAEGLTADTTVEVIEQLSAERMLPHDACERLWQLVRIRTPHGEILKTITSALREEPGPAAQAIQDRVAAYARTRQQWLKARSDQLRGDLGALGNVGKPSLEALYQRARLGVTPDELRHTLRQELYKFAPNSDVLKVVRKFAQARTRAMEQLAANLLHELDELVELPKESRRALPAALVAGGHADRVRAELHALVSDLPDESREAERVMAHGVDELIKWREANGEALVDEVLVVARELGVEAQTAIASAVHDGSPAEALEEVVADALVKLPANELIAERVGTFATDWAGWLAAQSDATLDQLAATVSLNDDLRELLSDGLRREANPQELPGQCLALIVGEVIGRHLEPLLTPESAEPFVEELKRRLPMEKKLMARLRVDDFVGRNQEQLLRAALRCVETTLQTVTIEDLPRFVKSYGWFSEKEEKHHASAILDMGTLVAEREIGQPGFPDPDDLLTALVENQVLREEEAAQVAQAMAASGQSQVSLVVPQVIALEPARRRKVAELKMAEVQSLLDQAVRAHVIYHKNIHYVIEGGNEIVIVDEFTGRKMPGRRWSEGLHEAVEAKERVEVRLESQTVATVTIQNYFRLYHKLAGMTGTAKTEEAEFVKTYGLEVVSIPTNRPVRRADDQDVIFKTLEAKTRQICFELLEHHVKGQPVLVGTRSVEVSERLSERLKAQHLQTLCLTQLIKFKLWDEKKLDKRTKADLVAALNVPLPQLNVAAVRGVAKDQGLDPEVTAGRNLHEIKERLNLTDAQVPTLQAALRGGVPHNVLNAKNHRNEARIVAEAARIGAVTIATNMAGRGVDILLGGTLDLEAKLRVVTRQLVRRKLRGEASRLRSRTVETTEALLARLTPNALQQLVWVAAVDDRLTALQHDKQLDLATAKEIRDAYATDLTAADLRNRVRARARRLNLTDRLPLDDEVLTDERLAAVRAWFWSESEPVANLRQVLESGLAAQSFQHDPRDTLLLRSLFRLAAREDERVYHLVLELTSLPDLDRALMETVAQGCGLEPERLVTELSRRHPKAQPVSATWVQDRLEAFEVRDSTAAQRWLGSSAAEVEFNDSQILSAVRARLVDGEATDRAWLQQKLRGLEVVRSERRYSSGDDNFIHLRVDREALRQLAGTINGANGNGARWLPDSEERWKLGDCEASLEEVGEFVRRESNHAKWATREWVETRLHELGVIRADEARVVLGHEGAPPTVLFRLRPKHLLELLNERLREAVVKVAHETGQNEDRSERIASELTAELPEAKAWVAAQWVSQRLTALGISSGQLPTVLVETGVAGQAADWSLLGEKRPEDVAQTSEYEEVRGFGGLHIIGTERHEARRIDYQLRGRAGRQGDPGSSRFYVSLEDELWRLFGVRGQFLLNQWQEDEQVEARLITKSIENAQKKVEMNHFESRKHTLQYDDVMNVQREAIYKMRRKALFGTGLRETLINLIADQAKWLVDRHCPPQLPPEEWDVRRLYAAVTKLFGGVRASDYVREAELHGKSRDELRAALVEALTSAYEVREGELGANHMRELERYWICESVDEYWMQHLAEMELLREGIGLRGWGQREPLVEYRKEAYDMFIQMMASIQNDTVENLMSVPVEAAVEWAGRRIKSRVSSMRYQWAETASTEAMGEVESYTNTQIKVGRNDPCPCGSGKKYKQCCLKRQRREE